MLLGLVRLRLLMRRDVGFGEYWTIEYGLGNWFAVLLGLGVGLGSFGWEVVIG